MSENITVRTCLRKVTTRTKIFDARCPGFYVSLAPSGTATFSLKYWDKTLSKQATVTIGDLGPDLSIEKARARAFDLKGQAGRGESVSQQARIAKAAQSKLSGVTINQLIDEFVAYTKVLVLKADGKKRPRLESWYNVSGYLEKNVRPAIGNKVCSEVINNDIAGIQNTVAARSTSSARQTRSAMNRMFAFGAEAGRSYITASPCVYLPKLDKEYERTRVLSEQEIRTFWWGLDDPNLPCIRSVSLALKFELVTMLRSQEVRAARRSELRQIGVDKPVLRIPLEFVKKRRVIQQPLNSLAVDIIKEATRTHNDDIIFNNRMIEGVMLERSALNRALNGKRTEHNARTGILDYLGMEHFTPHDLRRTSATLAADLGFPDLLIGKCLDHSKDRGENAVEAPTVTGRVYVQSQRLDEKRTLLDAIDNELRRIIGPRPARVGKAA